MKKQLGIANQDDYLKQTIIFTSFASSAGSYLPVAGMDQLKKVVDTKLLEYNESNAMMDLVLFEQAAEHITRISRIISNPSGNAMVQFFIMQVKCNIIKAKYTFLVDWCWRLRKAISISIGVFYKRL